MVRSRDFALILIFGALIILTVTGRLVNDRVEAAKASQQGTVLISSEQTIKLNDQSDNQEIDRKQSLEQMRAALMDEKVTADINAFTEEIEEIDNTVVTEIKDEDIVPKSDELVASVVVPALYCDGVETFMRAWPNDKMSWTEVEGARLLSHEVAVLELLTTEVEGVFTESVKTERQVLLQLPMAPSLLNGKYCLPYDVIAISDSGQLVRNTELTKYQNLPEGIFVGYTLDGNLLFSPNKSQKLDECGGYMQGNEYRYLVATSGSHIIKCFKAEPTSIVAN